MTRVVLAAILAPVLAAGCSGSAPGGRLAADYDGAGTLTRLAYDSNGDGRPDMVASMEGAAVRAVEVDEDADGLTDRWEYYERGDLPSRVERVARRGAVIVRRESFARGALVRVEEDRDADGRVDRWETYAAGSLTTLELDSSGAGRPDRRLRYDGDAVSIESVK